MLEPTYEQASGRPSIRLATPDDQSAILAIAVATGLFPEADIGGLEQSMAEYFATRATGHSWLVLDVRGEVAGAAYVAPEPFSDGTANLYFIAVAPERQGNGSGGALLGEVEACVCDWARILLIETSGLDGYKKTRAFYSKHGYTEEARIRDFYADGEDKVVFWKRLPKNQKPDRG